MQRYTVTIVAPGTTGERPVLLVPFQPSALVFALIEELYKRVARQGLSIASNTHIATLRLDGETGAIIDCEDLLSDVVTDPKTDKLFCIFDKKASAGSSQPSSEITEQTVPSNSKNEEPSLSVRIVTPSTAKDKDACPILQVSLAATIRQLHEKVKQELRITSSLDQQAEVLECNCTLANKLTLDASPPDQFIVIHGKSTVERLQLDSPTEASLKRTLCQRFGQNLESSKRVALPGEEFNFSNQYMYKKTPIAAICSKQRHTPVHANLDIDETGAAKFKVLDLHTSELPIHPACMDSTLEEAGLGDLASTGATDIYVVNRATTGKSAAAIRKSSIFRARSHWEPSVPQSDRGIAMFLSSLRVFASLIQDMRDNERSQDAVLHVFDLLTKFPPALRTLHILIQGKTPTAPESAALSQAIFEVLNGFIPTDLTGSDHSKVFEGSRLFFGLVLEKARTLKLPEEAGAALPYLSNFHNVDVRGLLTGEALMRAVQTSTGLVEAALFESFQEDGLLATSNLQTYMVKADVNTAVARRALLSGGSTADVTVFSLDKLLESYRYKDCGDVNMAIDLGELSELSHLAELCGRNKLAVHKPSQLSSAVAPCLTFDRAAHLAVYTGEMPCSEPGQSSIQSRPLHGDETINAAVIEQLISPLLQDYEADGTAVFDALGGAAVRRLQTPDEILMFCVDCSASMRQPTDFVEVNDPNSFQPQDDAGIEMYVQAELYGQTTFDEMKESLCEYEGFRDMLAIVGEAAEYNRRIITNQVLEILRTMLSSNIINQSKTVVKKRSGPHYYRQDLKDLETELNKLKAFWAGLRTHEDPVCDFLIYRATTSSHDISQRWTWSLGDVVPASAPSQQIFTLATDITELPDSLRCPISHTLMENAVSAADGHTYSDSAITRWFSIRSSSPMTGLQLEDTSLNANADICEAAVSWVNGHDIPEQNSVDEQPAKRVKVKKLEVTFDSRLGSFSRTILPSMTLKDLYKLAFRGLKAKALVFQLSTDSYGPLAPSPEGTVSSRNVKSGDHINVRIAEDDPISTSATTTTTPRSGDNVLIKVYRKKDDMLFGYWIKRDTTQTMASVLWKYWRYCLRNDRYVLLSEKQVWAQLEHSGDGLLQGTCMQTTEKLGIYLNATYCKGHLSAEKVYEEAGVHHNTVRGEPLVFKVSIMAPYKKHRERGRLSRLDVLKQMFEALINRMLAYNYKTHVGLITFASTPKVNMGISHVLENFRRSMTDMSEEGDTAIWDALAPAKDQLIEYGKKYPEAKKRIICISDGEDTKSTSKTPQDICYRLRQAEIATDTISLGSEDNLDLRTISYLLGCYSLHPTSLVNALAVCEMEPCLSLTERPPIVPPSGIPRHRLQFMGHFWNAKRSAKYTRVSADRVPPRKDHPNLHDEFVQLTAFTARPGNANGSDNSRGNMRISRLMNEMRSIAAAGAHPKYDVYVSETDMSFRKVVMDGPDETPYSQGTFLLYLHADEGYPTFAPKGRFVTKMKHPHVNAHGRICHSIFDRDWTSDTSMTTLLDSVYGLLLQPEYSDPVNTTTTLAYHHDQVEFADEVHDHVDRYASKTREEWEKTLLGEDEGEDEDLDEDDEIDDEDEYDE